MTPMGGGSHSGTRALIRAAILVAGGLLFGAAIRARPAQAQGMCEVARPIDGQRLLRRLSLDLRGRVPSHEEQLAQMGKTEVPREVIERLLAAPEFVAVMRRYHEDLLWPNLDPVEIAPLSHKLFPLEVRPGVVVYFSPLRALFLRAVTQSFVPCRGEPVQLDAAGNIRTFPLMAGGTVTAHQEGYVEVEPYWARGTKIKVCAFDAQVAETAPLCPVEWQRSPYLSQLCEQFSGYASLVRLQLAGAPTACDSSFSILAPGCGCGKDLRLCNTNETEAMIRRSLIEQQMRIVTDALVDDAAYTDILLTKRSAVNGHLAHYLTHQARLSFDIFGEPDRSAPIPADLSWASGAAWTPIARTGRHAGVLTTPGYLLKYQSNRGRAHRYYNAFACSAFLPAGALPSPSEPCSKREDLTKRCGCDACHTSLEPMAAHWGRFAEYGLSPLDESRYPTRFENVCANIQSIEQLVRCFRFYQLEAVGDELPFRGLLKPYVFRTAAESARLEVGPSALANDAIASGQFTTCTVRNLWRHFMRRAPTPDEESTLVPQLRRAFEASGYKLRALVGDIVTHPAYRRLP